MGSIPLPPSIRGYGKGAVSDMISGISKSLPFNNTSKLSENCVQFLDVFRFPTFEILVTCQVCTYLLNKPKQVQTSNRELKFIFYKKGAKIFVVARNLQKLSHLTPSNRRNNFCKYISCNNVNCNSFLINK